METVIKTLENVGIDTIHSTFVRAFADYQVDISYMTPDVLSNRFIKNGYHPELSAGVYENDQLQGFTIVGTGKFNGGRAAFDIMTGLLPEYRGKGIAVQLFDLITQRVQKARIDNFYLEVLQQNKPAIKTYTKTGFEKVRGLNCYALNVGKLKPANSIGTIIFIDEVDRSDLNNYLSFLDWEPSWENHFESIKRIPNDVKVIAARAFGKQVGVLVYYPTLKWIMTLAVHPDYRRKGVGTALLEYLMDYLPIYVREVKLMNVYDKDSTMNQFLKISGFEHIVSQYEMQLHLTGL